MDTWIAQSVAMIGTPELFWVLSAVLFLLLFVYRIGDAFLFLFALFATTGAIALLKSIFKVPRPSAGLFDTDSYAFPSAHAGASTFLVVMITYLFTSRIRSYPLAIFITVCAVLFGFLVSWSRIALGLHTPLQVAAGIFVGVAVPLLMIYGYHKLVLRAPPTPRDDRCVH